MIAGVCNSVFAPHQEICGTADGSFVMLGTFCFDSSKKKNDEVSLTTVSIDFNNNPPPPGLQLSFYDDQIGSFPSIWRANKGSPRTCKNVRDMSKGICGLDGVRTDCQHDIDVKTTPFSRSIQVSENFHRQWYFVLLNCNANASLPIKAPQYSVSAVHTVPCKSVFATNEANNVESGYIASIVILTLIGVALIIASMIFYKRTTIPELLTLDDTGYNEL